MDITDILDSELKFDNASVVIVGPGADLDDPTVFYYLNRNNAGKTYIVDKEDSFYPTNGFGNLIRFKGLLASFLEETNLQLSRNITFLNSNSTDLDKNLPENPDIISYRGVIQHMYDEDIKSTIESAFKILKPSGKIVIMTRKYLDSYNLLKEMLSANNLKEYDISDKEFFRIKADNAPVVPKFWSMFNDGELPIHSLYDNTVAFEPRFLTDRLLIAEK